ncbi:MAG: hypothetical protein J07HQX50_00727 [Haloquadratum sp. J07HQX50]|nr:MAG: hypothetical protein J07HQX50_00727 [Haloquadratum sp. J07HQX50]
MDSTRKGLRRGEIEKTTYERLRCAACDALLKAANDPEEVYTVRECPDCGRTWKELP